MIKPIKFSEVKELGFYMQIDFDNQCHKKWDSKPYGAWFYELSEDGWRSATGCLDVGPFDESDLFIGPIELY